MPTNDTFAAYLRPYLAAQLSAVGLAVEYHRARGDYVYYRDDGGAEVEILDLVGGFGGTLLGHNHPELVECHKRLLDAETPFLVQGSVRSAAGDLAARLARRIGAHTHRSYVTTLANSGTEAVEAALKHAELERGMRASAITTRLSHLNHAVRIRLQEQDAYLPDELFAEASRRFSLTKLDSLNELFIHLSRHVLDMLEKPPLFLAVEGAFHGKTAGALQLTHNPRFRVPWKAIGPRVEFLPRDDIGAIERLVERESIRYAELEIRDDGAVALVDRRFVNIGGLFVEPILGEGGVRALSDDYLRALRAIADDGGFPLVLDEIQSGMGRTGTFLASEPSGVRGDYYLLAKALGGGLAKISAMLVDSERYIPDFGYVHTSTYADDHLSSSIALKTLDLVEANDGAVIQQCRDKGAYLLDKLRALQQQYPDELVDVRGRGLFIGLELAPQHRSRSSLLRVLSEQERLGAFVAGYLLAEERIRVLPTLSAGATLRVEPSAFITHAELDRFCDAVERLLLALRASDGYRFARHLVGKAGVEVADHAPALAPPAPSISKRNFGQAHVGFLAHFLEERHLRVWDSTLGPFTDDDCGRFLARTGGAIEPFLAQQQQVADPLGNSVKVSVIGLPFTPTQALAELRSGRDDIILDLIHRAVRLARRLGCSVLGFGGYTSIITNNCRKIVVSDLAITSGNSLTAAAAIDAAMQAADRLGLERRVLGIVGAAGNIGRVLAETCADQVDEIVLVGRERAARRLRSVASDLYADAWQRASNGEVSGVTASICETGVLEDVIGEGSIGDQILLRMQEDFGESAPIRVATDLSALRACNMIMSASNAAHPIILPEHIGDGAVVISDVAVPQDVDASVARDRPKSVVLKGGVVMAPLGQYLEFEGLALRKGELFGCLAETILLGLAGVRENFSYGPLRSVQVRRIRQLARVHGFAIEENPV